MSDHYKTLGVEPNATAAEIKAAYRKLATKHQPREIDTGNAELMKIINNAYDNLKTPEKRAKYDRTRPSGNFNGTAGSSSSASAARPSGAGPSPRTDRRAEFEEAFFKEMSRRARYASVQAGRDRGFEEHHKENHHEKKNFRQDFSKNTTHNPDDPSFTIHGWMNSDPRRIGAILEKAALYVTGEDFSALEQVINNFNIRRDLKFRVAGRSVEWIAELPALAPNFKKIAIACVEKQLDHKLFEAIIKHAPKAFDRDDVGAIYNIVSNAYTNLKVRSNFGILGAKLVEANPAIGPHIGDLAIKIVEKNAGNELFRAIIRHKPEAFDRNHMAVIDGLIGMSFANPDMVANFQTLKAELARAKEEPRPETSQGARKPFWRFGF